MLQGGASNRNIAASSFGTDGFVFLLRYSAGPTTKSLIRHTCRHAYTSFRNYYIKLCVGAACAGFISFLLHFDFTKTLDRAPYRKNACVFESGFLPRARPPTNARGELPHTERGLAAHRPVLHRRVANEAALLDLRVGVEHRRELPLLGRAVLRTCQ